jgi:glycosyltransferase involved in cell wall biosynthesis
MKSTKCDPSRAKTIRAARNADLSRFLKTREVIAADVMKSSRFESLGMVHLESMAMCCPVVSMNNGGPAETIIDGETGYLVPPENPDALADRVIALLRDPALRERLGRTGRDHVLAHFTARDYARQISQLVDSLV